MVVYISSPGRYIVKRALEIGVYTIVSRLEFVVYNVRAIRHKRVRCTQNYGASSEVEFGRYSRN